jgi:Mg/Co/Ni transporter MgtE
LPLGEDDVRVIVTGQLSRERHNAPLHLFSAVPELEEFGSRSYEERSDQTSLVLRQLFEQLQQEGVRMVDTMEDCQRDVFKKEFSKLTAKKRREVFESLPPEERREVFESLPLGEQLAFLQALPPEERLAGLSEKQIREYLDRLTAHRPSKRRRKK